MPRAQYPYDENSIPVPGYRLVKVLGKGAIGQVWKAAAPGGKEVAFKVIPLTHHTAIGELESLRLLQKLSHSNLISIHALWLKDSRGRLVDDSTAAWTAALAEIRADLRAHQPEPSHVRMPSAQPAELLLAMDLGSSTLLKRLDECRAENLPGIPVEELLSYCEDAARGLDFLNSPIHDLGTGLVSIAHGDVKPDNIVIRGQTAALCDFGLAGAIGNLNASADLRGSSAYIAPETWQKRPHRNSDQYSLAITYFELRTGDFPFRKVNSLAEMRNIHLRGQLELSDLSPNERTVIERATNIDPNQRFRSSSKMVRLLRAACPISVMESAFFFPTSSTRSAPKAPEPSGESLVSPAPSDTLIRQFADTEGAADATLVTEPVKPSEIGLPLDADPAGWLTKRHVRDLILACAALIALIWTIIALTNH